MNINDLKKTVDAIASSADGIDLIDRIRNNSQILLQNSIDEVLVGILDEMPTFNSIVGAITGLSPHEEDMSDAEITFRGKDVLLLAACILAVETSIHLLTLRRSSEVSEAAKEIDDICAAIKEGKQEPVESEILGSIGKV